MNHLNQSGLMTPVVLNPSAQMNNNLLPPSDALFKSWTLNAVIPDETFLSPASSPDSGYGKSPQPEASIETRTVEKTSGAGYQGSREQKTAKKRRRGEAGQLVELARYFEGCPIPSSESKIVEQVKKTLPGFGTEPMSDFEAYSLTIRPNLNDRSSKLGKLEILMLTCRTFELEANARKILPNGKSFSNQQIGKLAFDALLPEGDFIEGSNGVKRRKTNQEKNKGLDILRTMWEADQMREALTDKLTAELKSELATLPSKPVCDKQPAQDMALENLLSITINEELPGFAVAPVGGVSLPVAAETPQASYQSPQGPYPCLQTYSPETQWGEQPLQYPQATVNTGNGYDFTPFVDAGVNQQFIFNSDLKALLDELVDMNNSAQQV